jgi:choline-sulfatase
MKDILIFMSDQHSASKLGCMGDTIVRTPNLDQIAQKGVVFDQAYTTCPLCVPARMSMLSARLCSAIGQLNNSGSIHSEQPTFLHSLAIAGYETVLCGRMHFEGLDQRHGFTKRIADDITPTHIGSGQEVINERGEYAITFGEPGSIRIIGGGNSPTLEYDRYVVNCALEYLQQEHDKPQCIVVGTYSPHFPYVAPEDLYEYYLDKVDIPETAQEDFNSVHTVHAKRMTDKSEKVVRAVRAAYYGMIEFNDQNIGKVHEAWKKYLEKNSREGLFVYLSDHGDHAGERGFYGKQSLYNASMHIPMIFEGDGIKSGVRIGSPASIMDLGPTLCEMAGAGMIPRQDGISLYNQLFTGEEKDSRIVIGEWINGMFSNERRFGRMVRKGDWKYITYADYPQDDELYNVIKDPLEMIQVKEEYPEIAEEMRELAYKGIDVDKIIQDNILRDENYNIIKQWGIATRVEGVGRWILTEEAKEKPKNYVSTDLPLPEGFKVLMKKL